MYGFASTSVKHESDQALLKRLSDAIYLLKLQTQGRLAEHGITAQDMYNTRDSVVQFIDDLKRRVLFLIDATVLDTNIDLAFTGIADRFVAYNSSDVEDRLDELMRTSTRIAQGQRLSDRELQHLDRLQSFLEEETAVGVRGLYNF